MIVIIISIILIILLTILYKKIYQTNDNCKPSLSTFGAPLGCGRCNKCKLILTRYYVYNTPYPSSVENFRFRDSYVDNYLKATKLTNYKDPDLASAVNVNTGLPFYFDAYGNKLSQGPKDEEPGAVATLAQYTDLYKAGQVLETQLGPFQMTNMYQPQADGGATSDLHLAYEEEYMLDKELNTPSNLNDYNALPS